MLTNDILSFEQLGPDFSPSGLVQQIGSTEPFGQHRSEIKTTTDSFSNFRKSPLLYEKMLV